MRKFSLKKTFLFILRKLLTAAITVIMKLLGEPNANQIDDNSVARFLNVTIIL